jgi:hypothetical protein
MENAYQAARTALRGLDDHRKVGPAKPARRSVGRVPVEDVELAVATRPHEERRATWDASGGCVGHPCKRVRDSGRLRVRRLRRVQALDRDNPGVRRRGEIQTVVVWELRDANLVEARA